MAYLKCSMQVHDARFPPPPLIFAIICCYHGNTLSATEKKNVSCTSTPQGKHLCQISWEKKNWGSSLRRKISPHFCQNMLLPWQHTFCHIFIVSFILAEVSNYVPFINIDKFRVLDNWIFFNRVLMIHIKIYSPDSNIDVNLRCW